MSFGTADCFCVYATSVWGCTAFSFAEVSYAVASSVIGSESDASAVIVSGISSISPTPSSCIPHFFGLLEPPFENIFAECKKADQHNSKADASFLPFGYVSRL